MSRLDFQMNRTGTYGYIVLEDGQPIGRIRKTHVGRTRGWLAPGFEVPFRTREEAAQALYETLLTAEKAIGALFEGEEQSCHVDRYSLKVLYVRGDHIGVEVDHGGPEHEGMHPDDCERERECYHIEGGKAVRP